MACAIYTAAANVRHRPLMLKQMDELGEKLIICTGHKALKVTTDGVICQDKDGKGVLVPGGSVIYALGQRSRSTVADELRDAAPFIRVIGDAAEVTAPQIILKSLHSSVRGGDGLSQ